MDGKEETTKYAKGAKREAKLLFEGERYKIIWGYFEGCKKKGNGLMEAVYLNQSLSRIS